MKWLLWKEYRANRLVLIVGAVLLAAPYMFLLGMCWFGPIHGTLAELIWVLGLAAVYSAGISQLTLALLGGNVIAGERADRSAEFLAYLPISRGRVLAGKLALVASTVALIWIPNLLIVCLASARIPEETMRTIFSRELVGSAILHTAITGAVFFSVAWLLSSMLQSPTFSICGGLVTPILITTAILMVGWGFDMPVDVAKPWYMGISLVLAPACFAAGTAYYLRRVEP
ncbi:MAG: ABC transporter permease subunit [Planctomycetes bacterium]|nr:ABC transporter permease subunit [Planctomycetota bacterium]